MRSPLRGRSSAAVAVLAAWVPVAVLALGGWLPAAHAARGGGIEWSATSPRVNQTHITRRGATLESTVDDAAKPEKLALEDLREALSAWLAFLQPGRPRGAD